MVEECIEKQSNLLTFFQRYFKDCPTYVKENNYPTFFPLNIGTAAGTLFHLGWLSVFFFLGVTPLSLLNIISVPIWATSFVLNRKGYHFNSFTFGAIEILLHQALCVIIIGWGTGFQYWIFMVPVTVVILQPGRVPYKIAVVACCCIEYAILDYLFRNSQPLTILEASTVDVIYYFNIISFSVIFPAVMFYFASNMNETRKALKTEHEKSESLLLNILPEPIADRLKTSSEVIADRFENVSILFLDIVKFTNMSEKVSARKVVSFLNQLFLIFDDLTEKHKLEKIKTIGDAYMVAAGIPEPCDDHAERIAKMSIDIIRALKEFNTKNGEDVKVRIGINSGSAVAGVIGRKKFAYDIWGDTVNTASRMEAYGEPCKIQVSEATYRLLKDKYDFTDRGIISVKGKGDMQTYFLNA